MKVRTNTSISAKLQIIRTSNPMNTALMVLLGIVFLSMMAFLILLLRAPLEDRDVWLKVMSGLLAAFVLPVGLWALWVGHVMNKVLEGRVSEQQERAAEAERKLVEAVRELARRTSRRFVDEVKLAAALKGKFDRARVEILYHQQDSDASSVAWQLYNSLGGKSGGVGWEVSEPKLIPAPDPTTDQRFPKFRYDNGAGKPLLITHNPEGVFVVHPERDWWPFNEPKTPGGALATALWNLGLLGSEGMTDSSMPKDFCIVVVGQKPMPLY